MQEMVDVHCHMLPYVDDGAETLEIAQEMLREHKRQGVERVVLTPHWRSHMFETSSEKIQEQFERMQSVVAQSNDMPTLLLGREYHYSQGFVEYMREHPLQTLGGSAFILLEFSYHEDGETMLNAIRTVQKAGYRVVTAHIERYAAVQKDKTFAQRIAQTGAWIQINAEAVLGKTGLSSKWLCKRLIKEGLVQLVASDSHDLERRAPNLGECASYIERKFGADTAQKLLCQNPKRLLETKLPAPLETT
jgi:protein-tyrosine phosphatase